MDDLEITKRCAEAMGMKLGEPRAEFRMGPITCRAVPEGKSYEIVWDPLHTDAQAMALVKRFRLDCVSIGDFGANPRWHVSHAGNLTGSYSNDLNRAICECVVQTRNAL